MMFVERLSTSLLRILESDHLTYSSAAGLCDISSRYMGDIIRRKTAPSIITLEKICLGLQRTPDELFGISQPGELTWYSMPARVRIVRSGENGQDGPDYPVCPRCGEPVWNKYQKYCSCCGQFFLWD